MISEEDHQIFENFWNPCAVTLNSTALQISFDLKILSIFENNMITENQSLHPKIEEICLSLYEGYYLVFENLQLQFKNFFYFKLRSFSISTQQEFQAILNFDSKIMYFSLQRKVLFHKSSNYYFNSSLQLSEKFIRQHNDQNFLQNGTDYDEAIVKWLLSCNEMVIRRNVFDT